MSIRFIIGRAGSGKTAACLEEVRGRLLAEPDGPPLILLVPEQATFQMEHTLVSDPKLGGLLRAQVLSFRRLAWRVMQETGATAGVPIDDLGKKMLLQRLLHKHNDSFRLFRSAYEKMGFTDRLHDLFSEFKRYRVDAAQLQRHAGRIAADAAGGKELTADKLHDLALLYREYEAELANGFLDGEEFLNRLAEQLAESAFMRDAEIWFDGFFGFTPQELAVVAACFRYCRAATVTLTLNRPYWPGETPHELDLFHPTATTMCRLQEAIRDAGLPEPEIRVLKQKTPPRFAESPMLAHLEAQYEHRLSACRKTYAPPAEESGGQARTKPQITLHAAVHRRAEAEAAAREMLRLVREEGLRWRDLAVRVRNIEEYGELLATVLTDHDIPFFFDRKRTILHHPLAELIRSALEVAVRKWPYEAVFRCVKTGFLLPPAAELAGGKTDDGGGKGVRVDRQAMDQFENYVLRYGIQGSRWLDPRSWEVKEAASLEDEDGASAPAATFDPFLVRACAQAVVGPLAAFQESLHKAGSVREMAAAVYGLLDGLKVAERLERWSEECILAGQPEKAREHGQVWDLVIDVLDQMAELMGDETMEPELFAKLMDTGLESLRLGLVPPALDQVLIGSIDRTRTAQVKHAFVLGVNDGVLPSKPGEDGILAESEREWLLEQGLPLAESSRRKLLDEQFLIYTVLCAPSQRLWLSYPLADEEGKSLLPSEIIKQIKGLFPSLRETLLLQEPDAGMTEREQLSYVAHPDRTLAYLLVQLKRRLRGHPIAPLWWAAYDWYATHPEYRAKLGAMLQALFQENREPPLAPATARKLYGSRLRASVSRMEAFVSCPFSHFATYGLKLAERRIYRLEAPDIGQLFHAALSGLARELAAEQADWGGLGEEELLRRVSAIVDRLSPRLQSEILLSSPRYRYVARKLKGIVGRASLILAEHARRSSFVPVGLEVGFGPGSPLPPLEFRLPNGCEMEIVGRIDRVDRADGAGGMLLRVIDYKSGPTALRLSELYYGLSLQMLTYLDVVLTHAERWLGLPAKPAGVLYFHVHNPLLQSRNALPPEAAEAALRKRFKTKGLVLADAEAVYLMDGSLRGKSGHSELIPVAVKADGSFYKSASVATELQWEHMRAYVRKLIRRIGAAITNGDVAIEPYRLGKQSACTFCPHKPVCQFDPLFAGNAPRFMKACAKEDIWLALEQSAADGEESENGRDKEGWR